MASKRKFLEALSREGLLSVAKAFEITGLTGKSKSEITDSLVATRGVSSEEMLGHFSRDDLKAICRDLDYDDSGREKQVLIDRLLGRDGAIDTPKLGAGRKEASMAKKTKNKSNSEPSLLDIEDYRHKEAKRKNNPPAQIAGEGIVPVMPKIEYAYSPRRPPVLQFDSSGQADNLPELLNEAGQRKLTNEEVRILADALRTQEPWLEWAGKREAESKGFLVDPLALNIHERVSAQAILKVAARQDVERMLFGDPEQEYHEAVQFYKHDIDWTNRLILGDSLHVMASLARREDLAGKVQMIYLDPPYGIKYGSNFQPQVRPGRVGDKDSDLTRELEMVKAYRDIWHLGIHSYLAYLRDRLVVARELLSDSGSVFVQISDDNLHRVRQLMEELFQADNCIAVIPFAKTTSATANLLACVNDYLLWYAKDKSQVKYRQLYEKKLAGTENAGSYKQIELPNGERTTIASLSLASQEDALEHGRVFRLGDTTSQNPGSRYEVTTHGRTYFPKGYWKTDEPGMQRLLSAERIVASRTSLGFVRYLDDFAAVPLTNLWADTTVSGASGKVYVVQTTPKVIERCILMATDAGDLVIDPTCGSGTTAFVAEQWGRRWISIDTSRVSIAIARQRILTAKFDYYELKDAQQGVAGGLECETVSHVTLGRIARNTNLDPIFAEYGLILQRCLADCNAALRKVTHEVRESLDRKLIDKARKEGRTSITEADRRRWNLPSSEMKWEQWNVPFDIDQDWPVELRNSVSAYRKAWRSKMGAVNACISANADQEELVNQPKEVQGVVRVSGPFTVEAVQPPELSLGAMVGFAGAPGDLETTVSIRPVESRTDLEGQNVEAYLDQMLRLLRIDGVRFQNNKESHFTRLDRLAGNDGCLHAEGRWALKGEQDNDPDGNATVAVAFGPQYGSVTAKQVEDVIRATNRRGYDDLVVAGFSFDGPAQAIINDSQHPKLRIHMAHISPDVNPAMDGLLKEKPGSQLFTVFGQPRTTVKGPDKRGEFTVMMEGVDIYDPVTNTIRSTEKEKVAAWFLDGDYDGRTFCITQAFFPDSSAWQKLSKALDGVVDPDRFRALSDVVSLPFPAGKHKCAAVKVIDPRGNEVMQVHRLGT